MDNEFLLAVGEHFWVVVLVVIIVVVAIVLPRFLGGDEEDEDEDEDSSKEPVERHTTASRGNRNCNSDDGGEKARKDFFS